MGRRHVRGLQKLKGIGRLRFDLAAVCDPNEASAHQLADLAAELLGRRPRVFPSLDDLLRHAPVDALAITTSPEFHASLGIAALQAGLDVLVEKPIALTIRQGRDLVAAARQCGRKLAVAENYRRDPVNRLAKALIDAGAIGRPVLAIQSSAGWGEQVIITPWRHQKRACGIAIDMGVHYTDILEYLLGPVERVGGLGTVVDTVRRDSAGQEHPADAEDLVIGVMRFASGALGNLVLHLAGRGQEHFTRLVYGTAGSLSIPGDRTGQPLGLTLRQGSDRPVPESEQLALVPSFALDPTTAALFGGERLTSYTMPWADIDANLLAIEHDDFAEAILTGREPEVTGEMGLRSLALIYGLLESDRLGRFITTDALLSRDDLPYQAEIEGVLAGGRP
jgi:predicted dehydrogenase